MYFTEAYHIIYSTQSISGINVLSVMYEKVNSSFTVCVQSSVMFLLAKYNDNTETIFYTSAFTVNLTKEEGGVVMSS